MKTANNQDFPEFNINELTEDDLLNGEKPFDYLYSLKSDPFYQSQELEKISRFAAKNFNIRNVKSMFENYEKTMDDRALRIVGVTDFKNQPLQLNLKNWQTDGWRIFKVNRFNEMDIACFHPIMPVQRIRNVDSGLEKINLAYCLKGIGWQNIIIEKSTIASPTKILELADCGISITVENAKSLISYLQEVEAYNYQLIPTVKSASRVGWVNGSFLPYGEEIIFDGQIDFKPLYDSITPKGDWETWLEGARAFRRKSPVCRIALATSMASPLLEVVESLPFFTHLWGSESATGKTVVAMVAASVWGNPEGGAYMQSFNSTEVADERTAAFLNSMPLVIDELQTGKKYQGKSTFNVYKITQGMGRARGTKSGGREQVTRWKLTGITTGETPLTNDSDGSGAHARVIDVEVNKRIFTATEGRKITSSIKDNYGMAGQKIVEIIKNLGPEEINKRYEKQLSEINEAKDVQDKQAMAAAALLTADEIADEFIFQDEMGALGLNDILPCLSSSEELSNAERALELTRDFIAANKGRFDEDRAKDFEIFGKRDDVEGVTYIFKREFNKLMGDAGFNSRSVLTDWKRRNLILFSGNREDKTVRINGEVLRCVALKDSEDAEVQTILPFM